MRWLLILLTTFIALLLSACGGVAEPTSSPAPDLSPEAEDVARDQSYTLAEGEFIDSKPVQGAAGQALRDFPGDGSLAAFVARSDAVIVGEVVEIVDLFISTSSAPPNWPVAEIENPPWSTYRVRVDQWLKGSGSAEILVGRFGGITPSGPYFLDGDFLLEPARSYVLILLNKQAVEPGPGQYTSYTSGRGGFEVTDGFVHVLNHPLTQDLQEQYGGMPLADFMQLLEGLIAPP